MSQQPKLPARLRTFASEWLLIAAALSLLAPLGALLGRLDWRLELFSHFLPQASVALLLAAWVTQQRLLRWALLLGGSASLGLILFTLAPSQTNSAATQGTAIRVLSANINLNNRELPTVTEQISQAKPDLVLLLEVTPAHWQALHTLRQGWPYGCSQTQDDPFGIALLSRRPLATCTIAGPSDNPAIVAQLSDSTLSIIGVHPPPPINQPLAVLRLEQLQHWASQLTGRPDVLLLGDLNLTPWSPHYRDLLAVSKLHDVRAGRGYFASWPTFLGPLGLPLDQALLGSGWRTQALTTLPISGSDHRALLLTLSQTSPNLEETLK